MNFNDMKNYLEVEMNMQYNYQPVVVLSLLKCPDYTASKTLLADQVWRYNQFCNKSYVQPLREAIQDTLEQKKPNIVSVLDGDKIKLNLDQVDQDSKNKLIDICYEQIAKWDSEWTLTPEGVREQITDSARIFLLQVSEKGSKEILQNKYLYPAWESPNNKRDRVYGEVKSGDVLLVYFANASIIHPKTVKMVYRVSSVSADRVELKLRPVKQLAGVSLDVVRENRDNGILGNKFNLIGQTGNITKISREDYWDMLVLDNKLKPTIGDEKFSITNSAVKKKMEENEYGPFSDLTSFLRHEEVEGYKGRILDKAINIFKIENGQPSWNSRKHENIVEALKEVASQDTVGPHLFRFRGGREKSEARILYHISAEDKKTQQEFEEKLLRFFDAKNEMEFGNRWDSLVSTIKSIKTKIHPDFLLLSYLAFLKNHLLYIPFTPTRADAIFKFFGISEKIAMNKDGKNWQNYSTLLELANELRLKLADHTELDLIDVQGYMWSFASTMLEKGINHEDDNENVDSSMDTQVFEDILEHNPQLILYGPPGTGKTYTAKKIAEAFTQKKFEESQPPTCFVALGGWSNWSHAIENGPLRWGVNPSTPSNLGVYNSVKEGDYVFFYQNQDEPVKFTKRGLFGVGRVTRKYTSDEPYWPDEISAGNAIYTQRFEMELLRIANDDSEMLPWIDGLPFTKGLNSIKNEEVLQKLLAELKNVWNINLNCTFIKRITFHQSFSYEEFIEGIKAEAKGNTVSYDVSPGIFKEFCNCARQNPEQKFVMIIDEINRGNISKILGELITLLEKDKRRDTASLPYSKELFSVPQNIYIVGTMNTADRSLVLLDVALRRRFAFYEMMPDSSLLKNKDIGGVDLTKLLDAINKRIRDQEMRDYQIGHSYFMEGVKPIQTDDDLKFSMVYEVIPLVKEYFYNQQKRIEEILGPELSSTEPKQKWKTDAKELVASLKREFFPNKPKEQQ